MLLDDGAFRYRVDEDEGTGQEMQEVEVSVVDVSDLDTAQMPPSLTQPSSQLQHLQGQLGQVQGKLTATTLTRSARASSGQAHSNNTSSGQAHSYNTYKVS